MKWLKKLLKKKKPLECGGERRIAVCDDLGREVASMWYTMPDSDLKISYAWDSQYIVENQDGMKRFSNASQKEKYQSLHKILVDDLYNPYGRKIFLRAEGFKVNGKDIMEYDIDEQFNQLAKFYSNCIVELCLVAYADSASLKKKD